jgi:hypothetical protein
MFRRSIYTAVVMMAVALIGPASARVIHIPSDYPNIQAGINAGVDGDTVMLSPGTYHENLIFYGKRILLTGQSGITSTFLEQQSINQPILRFENNENTYSVVSGLTFRNCTGAPAIKIYNCSPTISRNKFVNNTNSSDGGAISAFFEYVVYLMPHIIDNIFEGNSTTEGNGGSIYSYGGQMAISGNTFRSNHADGVINGHGGAIFIRSCDSAVVDHNLFIHNYCAVVGGAIDLSEDQGGEIYNNTLDSNFSSASNCAGIAAWYSNNFRIYNNIITNGGGTGILNYSGSGNNATYNDVWNNTTNYNGIQAGTGSVSANPLFIGGSPYSYRLASGSPCINTGDPDSPADSNGTRADMGYYGGSRVLPNLGRIIHVPGDYSLIQSAIDASHDGDTVLIAPGTYQQHFSFTGKRILLTSQSGPDVTILERLNINQPLIRFENDENASSIVSGFTVRNCQGAPAINVVNACPIIRNNKFLNNDSGNLPGGAIKVTNGTLKSVSIKYNVFEGNSTDSSGGAVFVYSTTADVSENIFRSNTAGTDGGALNLWGCCCSIVDHNLFVNNHCQTIGGAIALYQSYDDSVFNNTLDSNSTGGPYGGGMGSWNCSRNHYYDNIITNSSGIGFYVNPVEYNTATYNDVWNNSVNYGNIVPGEGSISANPIFVGGYPYSYALGAGSPCIDRGDPNIPHDPDGSVVDMGYIRDNGNTPHGSCIINVPISYSTIQAAINASTNGDTILVARGTYPEKIDFNGLNIIVASNYLFSGDTTDIQATIIQGQSFWNYPVVTFDQNEAVSAKLIGFHILYGRLGVYAWHASPQILNNIIELGNNTNNEGLGGGICWHGGTMTVVGNTIKNCLAFRAGAIWADSGCSGTIHHNVIYNNTTEDIACGIGLSGTGAISIYNNTLCHNQEYASYYPSYGTIYVAVASVPCQIYNNIIAFNTTGLACAGSWDIDHSYNDIFGNTNSNYYNCIPATGEIALDPDLVGSMPGDFRIYDFSPCVNSGCPTCLLDPDSSISDMGALWPPVSDYGYVSGMIIDNIRRLPVAGANIYMIGGGPHSQSDTNGIFILRIVPNSESFSLAITSQGYVDTSLSGINVLVGDTTVLDTILLRTGIGSLNYVAGDFNGNGDATPLADIIYGKNAVSGGPPPVSIFCTNQFFPATADVNGNCNFNGIDIVYATNYWTNNAANMLSCGTCPTPRADPLLPPSGLDPGLQDSIIIGNIDRTPIPAFSGDTVSIPIWVINDENVAALNIPVAIDTSYISRWSTGAKYSPISGWSGCNFRTAEIGRPIPGYATQTLLGWRINTNDSLPLNTYMDYQAIGSFKAIVTTNPGNINDTIQIIPSNHSRAGGAMFCDMAGLNEWSPAIVGGSIVLMGPSPHIALSQAAFIDTIGAGVIENKNLYISNLGTENLTYSINWDSSWIAINPISGLVPAGERDTVRVTLNASNLDSGEYTSQITVASNDTIRGAIILPVTLIVTDIGHGCDYHVGDINGNGQTNGIDVTYAVGFFKGGAIPLIDCGSPIGPCPQTSPFYAAGDVNGSCVFNGIDITFFVGYLKGGPGLIFCPSCPPPGLSAPATGTLPDLPLIKIGNGEWGNGN